MLTVALALALAQYPSHWLQRQPNLPQGPAYAFFEAFPASGAGTFGACSTTPPTGAKGETLTFTRASVAECYSNDGQTLTQMSANQPRVSSGRIDSTWMGIWNEVASQNDVPYARDLSQASWVKTSMTCAKTATGMRGDANGASTCTASGANGTVIYSLVVAASARVGGFHVKRLVGTGAVEVTRDNGATWTPITSSVSSSRWRRVVPWETPGCAGGDCIVVPSFASTAANPTIGIRLATSGDAVAVDFAQDEAGTKATTPIATAGAAVPRSAESGYFTVPSFTARSMRVGVQPNGQLASFGTPMQAWADANNSLLLWAENGGSAQVALKCTNQRGGVNNDATGFLYLPVNASTFVPASCEVVDSTSITWTQRGVPSVTVTATTAPPGVTRIYLGNNTFGAAYDTNGVVRGACADPVNGRCAFTSFESDGALVALGDSITLGSAQIPTRWVYNLGQSLNRPIYNLGLTGASVAQCLSDYRNYVRGKGYSGITVLCGVNSLIAGDSATSIMTTLTTLLDEARADGLTVKVGTILPWSNYASWTAGKQTETLALNASILSYCTTNSLSCVDFYNSAIRTGTALGAGYDSGDGIHPNAAGGALMATLWAAAFP